ncbi:MAG: SDR family NAD(P)-dependent oxidoreductase, partial [Spirochaetales bacterium]|nr:SDR family NAD(P)-dependent oxidoreductase [Spirochaetales bacterium]
MMNKIPSALITGASRGLGRGAALELAKAGFSLAINYAGNKEAAQECLKLCAGAAVKEKQKFEIFQADIGVR